MARVGQPNFLRRACNLPPTTAVQWVMHTDPFDRALQFVLAHEGGYVNDPADPGGETNMGISKRKYPQLNIRDLTVAEASDIYRHDYWHAFGCDKLPPTLALVHFDTNVNMRPEAAAELLAKSSDPTDYLARRILRYAEYPAFSRYGRGWVRRVLDLQTLIVKEG